MFQRKELVTLGGRVWESTQDGKEKKIFSYKIFRNFLAQLGKEDRNLQLLEEKACKNISNLNTSLLFILA